MANVRNKKNVKTRFPVRLQEAAEQWHIHTRPMRETTKKMLEHYAGGWYSDGVNSGATSASVQPLNLVDRAVSILAPYLVGGPPKVMIDVKRGFDSNRPFARTLELALEHLFREISLQQLTLRPAVISSLFSMGHAKTGIAKAGEVEIFGYMHDVGQPYCDVFDDTDYIGDVAARNREEMEFEGHEFTLSEEAVKDSGLFKHYDKLDPESEIDGSSTRPFHISRSADGQGANLQSLYRYVRLQDIWLPKEGIIITIPLRGQGKKIMRTVEWDGPESGPFDSLAYKYFPGSVVPIPPAFTWMPYNNIINTLVRKMKRQAEREKKFIAYDTSAAQDMKNVNNTPDGSTVGVRDVNSMKEFELGGVSESNWPFMQWMEQQYSLASGNLYTIGGRQTQAETLGQEQMLQANASKQLEDMVQQVHQFTKSITEKLGWFMWSNPLMPIPVIKSVAGYNIEVIFSDETKEGDYWDYAYDIEPYSMTKQSPSTRYQLLMQLISQVVLPTADIAAQQGSMLNVTELVKEASRFLDIRNIDRWWIPGVPQESQMNPYQPMQGQTKAKAKPKSGQDDGRFSSGDNNASNQSNLSQQQGRAFQKSSSSGGSSSGY